MVNWTFASSVFLGLAASQAGAHAGGDEWDKCTGSGLEADLESCTAVIDSGRFSGEALAVSYLARGFDYLSRNQPDSAIADFNNAIRLEPTWETGFEGLGNAYNLKADYADAIKSYDKALGIKFNATLASNRAYALLKLKRYREAPRGMRSLGRFHQAASNTASGSDQVLHLGEVVHIRLVRAVLVED